MLTHRPFRVTDDCLTRSPESDCHSRAPLIQLPGHVCPRIAPGTLFRLSYQFLGWLQIADVGMTATLTVQ